MDVLKEMVDIARLVPVAEFLLSHEPEEMLDHPEIGELVNRVVFDAVSEGDLLTEEGVARAILYLSRTDRTFLVHRLLNLQKSEGV